MCLCGMKPEDAQGGLGNVVAFPRRTPRERPVYNDCYAPIIAIAVVVFAGVGLAMWRAAADRQAIQMLGEPERRALMLRTEEDLRTACSKPSDGLAEYCERQASFLLGFPECDGTCKSLAREQLTRAKAVR